MDVYTFTYSDGYDIPDIHGWDYYLMDDFLFIIYIIHGTWNGYVLHVLLAKSFCQWYSDGIWPCAAMDLYGQPTSVDDGCAMRKCGSRDFKWLRIG